MAANDGGETMAADRDLERLRELWALLEQDVDRYTPDPEREFCIDNLLVRVHFIIVMIRWTGLAPSSHGSLNSLFQVALHLPS